MTDAEYIDVKSEEQVKREWRCFVYVEVYESKEEMRSEGWRECSR